MPDREHEGRLERELRELGDRVEYPPTPDLARTVRRHLDEESAHGPARRLWSPILSARWAAAAAVLVLILAVPVLSPAARETVAGWFVSGGAAGGGQQAGAGSGADRAPDTARAGDAVPEPAGGVPSSAGPVLEASAGDARSLELGERITLREARAQVGADGLLLPRMPKLGKPDEIYALGSPHEDGVALVYLARPGLPPLGDNGVGLLLIELSGGLESTYLAEDPPAGTELEEVSVSKERGYWVPDGRHLRSQAGKAERLPGGALLWERKGRALLLRADLPKEAAIRIAASVR
jgi:hypothetical protein